MDGSVHGTGDNITALHSHLRQLAMQRANVWQPGTLRGMSYSSSAMCKNWSRMSLGSAFISYSARGRNVTGTCLKYGFLAIS